MPETREQIIERMAVAYRGAPGVIAYDRRGMNAALPVAVKEVTDQLRLLHRNLNGFCVGCWEAGGSDGAPEYPCPTARLLDRLDAELGGE